MIKWASSGRGCLAWPRLHQHGLYLQYCSRSPELSRQLPTTESWHLCLGHEPVLQDGVAYILLSPSCYLLFGFIVAVVAGTRFLSWISGGREFGVGEPLLDIKLDFIIVTLVIFMVWGPNNPLMVKARPGWMLSLPHYGLEGCLHRSRCLDCVICKVCSSKVVKLFFTAGGRIPILCCVVPGQLGKSRARVAVFAVVLPQMMLLLAVLVALVVALMLLLLVFAITVLISCFSSLLLLAANLVFFCASKPSLRMSCFFKNFCRTHTLLASGTILLKVINHLCAEY